MNQQYFIIKTKSAVKVAEIVEEQAAGYVKYEFNAYSEQQFKLAEANTIIGEVEVADLWLMNKDRRTAHGFTIDLDAKYGEIVKGKFNEWQGFSVEPVPGDPRPFAQHIIKLCGGDIDLANYMMKWIAYGFQNPRGVAKTCIMLIGKQGSGKGLVGNFLHRLWGAHGVVINRKDQLVGRFNGHLRGKGFAFVDEPPFAGDKQAADVLKHMITEPFFHCEAKFQDGVEVENMLKLLCASNHYWTATVAPDDRRFVVIGVPDKLCSDKGWLTSFYHWSRKPENAAATLHHLLRMDLSDFDPERDRPETAALTNQKMESLTGPAFYWRLVIEAESWNIGRGVLQQPDQPILEQQPKGESDWHRAKRLEGNKWREEAFLKASIYEHFQRWHAENQKGNATSFSHFWKVTKDIFGVWDERKIKQGASQNNRKAAVQLPSFEEMQRKMSEWLAKRG